MTPRPDRPQAPAATVDWGKALVAGLVATVVITVTMAIFGQNIMKMLGGMLAPGAGTAVQYVLGGIVHLAVGLFYGVLYAWLLGPVLAHGSVVKGLLYGAALTGIALALMPAAGAMMGGAGGGGPCNPCGPDGHAASPCNPCNPCNPCGPDGQAASPCNPCNPCGPSGEPGAQSPCGPSAGGGPCGPQAAGGPCSPCGGGKGDPWGGVVSLLNHLVYGLVLALVYER